VAVWSIQLNVKRPSCERVSAHRVLFLHDITIVVHLYCLLSRSHDGSTHCCPGCVCVCWQFITCLLLAVHLWHTDTFRWGRLAELEPEKQQRAEPTAGSDDESKPESALRLPGCSSSSSSSSADLRLPLLRPSTQNIRISVGFQRTEPVVWCVTVDLNESQREPVKTRFHWPGYNLKTHFVSSSQMLGWTVGHQSEAHHSEGWLIPSSCSSSLQRCCHRLQKIKSFKCLKK